MSHSQLCWLFWIFLLNFSLPHNVLATLRSRNKKDIVLINGIFQYADNTVSVIPDFIANCGMARVFAYLMQDNIELTDEAIFSDTSETIRQALERIHEVNHARTGISSKALELAIGQLV